MNNKAIYFIGGFIWALVSSRKAYAPNINSNVTKGNQTNPQVSANPISFKAESKEDCPEGYGFFRNYCIDLKATV